MARMDSADTRVAIGGGGAKLTTPFSSSKAASACMDELVSRVLHLLMVSNKQGTIVILNTIIKNGN